MRLSPGRLGVARLGAIGRARVGSFCPFVALLAYPPVLVASFRRDFRQPTQSPVTVRSREPSGAYVALRGYFRLVQRVALR
jgi:hypothetical protein